MEDDKLKDTAAEVRKEAETESGAQAAEAQPAQQPEAAVKQEPSELDKLNAELDKAKEEIKGLTEEAARARADYYNFRTRVERDRERDRKLASEKAIKDLLPVYENLDRLVDAVEDKEGSLYKGMSMICRQFSAAMQNLGLEQIPTDGKFDPALHEAVSMEPVADEAKDGFIIGALRKGYRLAGRVIRAPQVRVGKFTGKQE